MTLKRAALFAAIAAALQLLVFLAATFAPYLYNVMEHGAPDDPNQFLLISNVALLVAWAAFLFMIYRECSGVAMALPSQKIAFILVLLRAGIFLGLELGSIFLDDGWQPNVRTLLGLVSSAGWLAFLIAYTINPDVSRARTAALCLAVLVAGSGIYSTRAPLQQWLALPAADWGDFVLLAAPILGWIADANFLWAFWKTAPITEHTSPSEAEAL